MARPVCAIVGSGEGLGAFAAARGVLPGMLARGRGTMMMGSGYAKDKVADPDDVARTYPWVHQQPRSAWSNEVELRPWTEDWTI